MCEPLAVQLKLQFPMPATPLTLETRAGSCPAYLVTPADNGRWPGVVFYGDAGGMRPAMIEMAQRLADAGYAVLLPDPFYRYGPYKTLVPKEVFRGDVMAVLGPLLAATDNDKSVEDTETFIEYLDGCDSVAGEKLGAVGFCMGGGMAICAAGAYSQRSAAVASFHGGNLATDSPTSPHLRAAGIRAEVLVANAENDDSCPPTMVSRLTAALDEAGVRYRATTFADAVHGWMVTDFPVFDGVLAERGWQELLALFQRHLRT